MGPPAAAANGAGGRLRLASMPQVLLLVVVVFLAVTPGGVLAFFHNSLPRRPARRQAQAAGRRRWSLAAAAAAAKTSDGGGNEDSIGVRARFVSPAIPSSASVSDLLEYLGDTRTRRRAARRLLRKPEAVPSEGMAALVEATARLGNTSGVQQLLAMMRQVGDAPTAALYESLLKMANARLYWDMALALLKEAEADGVSVTDAMLGATLHSCLQADRPREATNLLRRFEQHGSQPSLPLLMALIRLLSDKGMVPALREVSTALARLEVAGDAALYTALVSAFGRAGSHADVLEAAQLVEGRGLADKGRIYSTAVAALLVGGLVDRALGLYDKGLADGAEIGPRGYEALVQAAAASPDPSQAAFFLGEMRARAGAAPPAKAYWRPIGACLRCGRLAAAAALVQAYYCEVEGTRADPAPLNKLVKAACVDSGAAGDRALAVRVYEAVRARLPGFVGNSFTAMVLMGAHRTEGDLQAMAALHRDMLAAGVEAWLPAASNVMYAYAKLGRVEEELRVFQALAASPSQAPVPPARGQGQGQGEDKAAGAWRRVLSRAMFLAKEHGRADTAATVLSFLQRHKHLTAGAKDYSNLIKAFSAAGQPEAALQVLVLMNQRKAAAAANGDRAGTLHYNAVMHAFARQGRMRDAETVLAEMRMRQVQPDAATYNVLIAGFERQRQPERALALYEDMARAGVAPDAYVLNSLVAVTADMKDRPRARELLQQFRALLAGEERGAAEEDPAAGAAVMYGALMHALARTDAAGRREALALLEEYKQKQEGAPNTIMYNEALYACYRLVREEPGAMADKALALFREMLPVGAGADDAEAAVAPAAVTGTAAAAAPDALTFRRLFKVLKQARRFAEMADIAASLPKELLLSHERISVPVVTACLRQGQQARALELLGELALRPNASYGTLRWAATAYCTKVTPPDVNAAEMILALVEERGWRADRGFHHALMRAHWTLADIPRALEVWHALPERFQGGDGAAVAILCHMERGRLERVSPLFEVMRAQDDVGGADLMAEILERLVRNEDNKLALEAVEMMVDFDVAIAKAERGRIEALAMQNPQRQGVMALLEGLALLPLPHHGGGREEDVDNEGDGGEDEG